MKKNKAKQMLLSLGLMATVASPLVTVISCGESDETAPEITVDQKTTLDGETVQGSGTEYTLSLTQGTTVTQEKIEGLFTVDDDMDDDVTLTYNWETGPFEAATTGECVLTISSEDAAGNSVAYTLTITVSPPQVEEPEVELDVADAHPTIAVDTVTAADSGDTNSVVSDSGDGTGTLTLTTGSGATEVNVQSLFSASDAEDGDLTASLSFSWDPKLSTSQSGTYKLTVEVTDSASQTATYVLTVTVANAVVAEPEVEPDVADAHPTIAVDTVTAADSGDTNSVVSDSGDGTGTLTLTTGSSATEVNVQSLFSASDAEDGDLTASLSFSWDPKLSTSQAGTYKLTVEVTDSASQTATYVLTVTVANAVVAEPEVEPDVADAHPTIAVDTVTAADSGDTNSVVSDSGDGTGTLTLTTGSSATEVNVQSLFSASDAEDGDLTASLSFSWNPKLSTSQAGTYKLTVEVTDSASQTATYVLTVTVTKHAPGGAGSGTGETGSSGSGGGETLDTTVPVLTETGTLSGAEALGGDAATGYTLNLATDTVTTVTEVEALFTATDDTDKDVKVNVVWDTTPTDFTAASTYVATFTATDVAGNEAEVTLTVTVTEEDTTVPVLTETGTLSGAEALGGDAATGYTLNLATDTVTTVTEVEALFTATDDTDKDVKVNVVWDTTPTDFTAASTYVATFTATDVAGNEAEVTLTVTVTEEDTTVPVLTETGTLSGAEALGGDAATGYTLNLATDTVTTVTEVEALFTATDDTDKDVKVNVVWDTTPTDFTAASTYVATFTATDVAGNEAEVTLTVTVTEEDTTVPVLTETGTLSGAEALGGDAATGYTLNLATDTVTTVTEVEALFTATDDTDKDVKVNVVWDTTPTDFTAASTYVATFTATDVAGNEAEVTLTVTVTEEDTTVPVLTETGTLSGAEALGGDAATGYTLNLATDTVTTVTEVEALFTATDDTDKDVKVNVVWDTTPTDFTAASTYVATFTATDVAGNEAEVTLTVTVTEEDTTVPVLTETGTLSGAEALGGDAATGYTLNLATDTVTTVTEVEALFTATDDTDKDVKVNVVWDTTPTDFTAASTYVATFTATDVAGNEAEVTLTVTVTEEDTTVPVLTETGTLSGAEALGGDAATGYTLNLATDTVTTVTEVEALFTATDDTDKDVKVNVVWDTTPTDFTAASTYVATFTATDVAGNEAEVTLTVTVTEEDTTAVNLQVVLDKLVTKIKFESGTTVKNNNATKETAIALIKADASYTGLTTAEKEAVDAVLVKENATVNTVDMQITFTDGTDSYTVTYTVEEETVN